MCSGDIETNIIETPQESIINPVLANIFLHELVVEKLK